MTILDLKLTTADAEATEFAPIPVGEYKVIIQSTTQMNESTGVEGFRTTASGGTAIPVVFVILEGEHKEKKIFDNLNIVNDNPVAMSIAKRRLAQITIAAGIRPEDLKDTNQLHGKIIKVSTIIEPAKKDPKTGKTYKAHTSITDYKSINGGNSLPTAAPAEPETQSMPWAQK